MTMPEKMVINGCPWAGTATGRLGCNYGNSSRTNEFHRLRRDRRRDVPGVFGDERISEIMDAHHKVKIILTACVAILAMALSYFGPREK